MTNTIYQPVNTLDHIRKSFNSATNRDERARIGQFLTPVAIARFMSSLFENRTQAVRILDPGAGSGVLFATCVESLILRKNHPHSIEVVAYETDKCILPYLQETMTRCELLCHSHAVTFHGIIRTEDFVESAITETEETLFVVPGRRFTNVILNPPYKKINGQASVTKMLYSAGMEVGNLYAAFVWLSFRLLEPGGQIVAITPRSFCNGSYFKKFRVALLSNMNLKRIHVFVSRKKAFRDDDVLQENVIFHAKKEQRKPKFVTISASEGIDFDEKRILTIPYRHVVHPADKDAFIHISMDDTSLDIIKRMESFSSSLSELNLNVSTGRTVDFRMREHLSQLPRQDTVPLIYPCHFQDGFVSWPLNNGKKPNAITLSCETSDLLLEAGVYVLTKRFSSKEQPKRIMAAIYDPARIDAPYVSFENHLNYFHRQGKGLPADMAKGLLLYLNSTIVDQYFRLFSGNTQVNATDLRKIPYPADDQLSRIGAYVKTQIPDQETIDAIIEKECESRE